MIEQALLDSIHKIIFDTVKDFIIAPGSSNEILLIRSPSGVGSTHNTREACFNADVYTVWAGPHPLQVMSDIANVKSIPYLSSITKENCINYDQVEKLKERGFIPQKILCDKKCNNRTACDYYKMRDNVAKSKNGFCMYHTSLRSKLVEDSFGMSEKAQKVLVIDSSFLHSLSSTNIFNKYDLEDFITFINNTWLPNVPNVKATEQDYLKFIVSITKNLKDSLAQDLTGSQIAINLLKIPPHPTINIQTFSTINSKLYMKDLIKDYYQIIASNPNILPQNLLEPIYDIIMLTIQYNASDVIFPFEIKNKYLIYKTIKSTLPLDVPVIIIDTHAPPDLYQNIFNRKIKILDILSLFPSLNQTPDNLKIYQYDRGRLPKKSLYFQHIKDWLFPTIGEYLKLKPKTKHVIYIANDYMSILATHLYNNSIKNFEMHYFYDAISKGSKSLKDTNNMIIVGTPEPNAKKLKSQIEMFHIGESPLDMTYDKTTKTYNDKRVQVFYAIQNSEHIRTLIYKMRPLTSRSQKTVLLFSNITLKENTERLTTQDLKFRIKNANMNLSREKALLQISQEGEMIAKRIEKVIMNYLNKHATQDKVSSSIIIRNIKIKKEFKNLNNLIILDPDFQDFMGYKETTERTEDTEKH